MAEKSESTSDICSSKQEDKSTGNWWDSWISSTKTKSAEVYTMVKKDLAEIGTTMKSGASQVFSSTSNLIGTTLKTDVPESPANVMKKSFTTFIDQVSTVLNPEPDDEDDTEVILSSGDTTMLSTYKKELEALQRVDATYIVPADSPEFDAWRASLDGSEPLQRAFRKMGSSPLLKEQYGRLVPDAVTHDEFWERYLFRVALLQDRLSAAARRVPQATNDPVLAHLPPVIDQSPKKVLSGIVLDNYEPDTETVTWEDEDFANDLELTEEQQTLLLEEYEKEITSKRKPNRDTVNNNKQMDTTDNNKNMKSPQKFKDVCGNLVEDYFGEKEFNDDASANSDESWEKFEIEEQAQKA